MNNLDKNKSRARLEQRESDIMEAATRLFAEEGFHGTSTRKIAAAAGVSEGTLFHYFSTKNVLLLAILDDFYAKLIESAQDVTQEVMGTHDRLLLLAKNHLRALMENQALMMRPTYGAAQYSTPLPGLYLCGAGSHPDAIIFVSDPFVVRRWLAFESKADPSSVCGAPGCDQLKNGLLPGKNRLGI